ncbi:hypothetical protein BSNK01_00030 [Bacillaceae bacterium]
MFEKNLPENYWNIIDDLALTKQQYYCQDCNYLHTDEKCPACGSEKRQPIVINVFSE